MSVTSPEGSPTPELVTSPLSLAVAHGPGVSAVPSGGPYSTLVQGSTFTKFHQQPSFLNTSGKRFLFYQHNHLFWLKPHVHRPRPGEEDSIDPQYQAPLTSIVEVVAGKTPTTFHSSKAAQAVAEERAWSVLIQRGDGAKEEHLDLEAANKEERDHWVAALSSLVSTARQTLAEKEGKVKVVDVHTTVTAVGDVTVAIALIAAPPSPAAAAAASAAPLPNLTTTASIGHLTTSGITITDAASTQSTRPVATSTTTLESSSASDAHSHRVKALEEENAALKVRIAELEERLKGSEVNTVAAS